MGWDFTRDASKADIVKDCLFGGAKPTEYVPIAHKTVGNCLWVVFEHDSQDRNARFIGLYLLEKQRGYGWGYKPMDEGMGPYELSCPLQFLDITPLPQSPFAEAWRAKVRDYHAQKTGGQGSIPSREHVRSTYGVDPQNCGDCLMEHVDVVLLNADGKCSCCATGHKLAGKQVA